VRCGSKKPSTVGTLVDRACLSDELLDLTEGNIREDVVELLATRAAHATTLDNGPLLFDTHNARRVLLHHS
jgi:hypothetical protein